jgi:BASS family bile acid:Na+ symporter
LQLVAEVLVPAVLVFLMFVVGLELTPADFRRVLEMPGTVAAGVAGQLILLPMLAGTVLLLASPSDHIAAGLILLVASPAGAISNFYVYYARANVALSVTLTAVTSLVGVVTLPLLTGAGFDLFVRPAAAFEVPVAGLMVQLFGLLIPPLAVGMILRARFPDLVHRHREILQRASLAAVVILLVVIFWGGAARHLLEIFADLTLALLFTLLAMIVGFVLAAAIRSPLANRVTFAIEFAVRNLAIAAFIGATVLGQMEFVLLAACVFVVQAPVMLLFGTLARRCLTRVQSSAAGRFAT